MNRSARFTARPAVGIAVAALAAVTLAACGDDGPSEANQTTTAESTVAETTTPADTTTPDTTAPDTTAPDTTATGDTVASDLTYELADATEALVGLPLDEAEDIATENDWIIRPIRVDGEDRPMTMDWRPNRVNVAVEDDIITEVLHGG